MNKSDLKDVPVEALLWSLTILDAAPTFTRRHWRWALAPALLLGIVLARRAKR